MAVTGKWYTNGLKGFLMGTYNWKTSGGSTIKCALIKNTYTPDQDAHDFWDDVSANECDASGNYSAGGITVTPSDPTVDTATNETRLDCADMSATTFTGTVRYLVFYYSSGTPGTSNLICYCDLGADTTAAAGTFTITIATTGILKITAA